MKTKTTITIIIILIATMICASCGKVKNYDYSPAVVKGIWVCESKNIILDFNDCTGTIEINGISQNVKCAIQVNADKLFIDHSESAEGQNISLRKGDCYIFKCEYYDAMMSAKAYEDYDIFNKGEELTFILKE